MIRKILLFFLFFLNQEQFSFAQLSNDSLIRVLTESDNDTAKVSALSPLIEYYGQTSPDTAYLFSGQLLQLSERLNFKLEQVNALSGMGYALSNLGNYPKALQTFLTALPIAEDARSEKNILPDKYFDASLYLKHPVTPRMRRLSMLAQTHMFLGLLNNNMSNTAEELSHYLTAMKFAEESGNVKNVCEISITLGRVYLTLKKTDSALWYQHKAYDLATKTGYKKYMGSILLNLGRIESTLGNKEKARNYFRQAIEVSRNQNYLRGVFAANLNLSELYREEGRQDSTLYYVRAAFDIAKTLNSSAMLLRTYRALAAYYRNTEQDDSTIKYLELTLKINDSIFNSKQAQMYQSIASDEEQREKEMAVAKKDYQQRLQNYLLTAGLVFFLIAAIFLLRSNRNRKNTNAKLQKQKAELEVALGELKATQKQLIQSEKMASLGELTAGIAHEIQNPLNFVNNFSELNKELIADMLTELEAGRIQEAKTIATSIEDNETKITQHGKRADAIVKSMLLHSRSSSGKKEATDINALVDEYVRLAFHGWKAKDKSFTAQFETELDPAVEKINVVPQDLGRVILNLINNAFYAVNEKRKNLGTGYEPVVTVATKKIDSAIRISVKDNGEGIDDSIRDKIFQPFFTTKAAGKGTGLGLSMSYDIIKNGHEGELTVQSKKNEGSEFTIILPD